MPHCLGTPDGFFAKTNNAKLLHFLLEEYPGAPGYPNDAFHIEDGNALVYTLTNLAATFGEICLQILNQMTGKKTLFFPLKVIIQIQSKVKRDCAGAHLNDTL